MNWIKKYLQDPKTKWAWLFIIVLGVCFLLAGAPWYYVVTGWVIYVLMFYAFRNNE